MNLQVRTRRETGSEHALRDGSRDEDAGGGGPPATGRRHDQLWQSAPSQSAALREPLAADRPQAGRPRRQDRRPHSTHPSRSNLTDFSN